MKEYLIDANPDLNFDDWNHTETLTVVYPKVSREVKDDFYENKFNGEVSKFYMKDKDIICGVLAKPVERTKQSGEVVKGVEICGIYFNRERRDNIAPLLEDYVSYVKWYPTNKKPTSFKQKYFFVQAVPDNEEQLHLVESIGFEKEKIGSDMYYQDV